VRLKRLEATARVQEISTGGWKNFSQKVLLFNKLLNKYFSTAFQPHFNRAWKCLTNGLSALAHLT